MRQFELDKNYRMEYNESTGLWDYYKKDNLVSKEADKLFKYYSLNINNIDALLNNYFHLSNPESFNDPFDCNVNIAMNTEDITNKIKTVKRNNIGNIGISSFSEIIDSHLMWAHYTNNYKGFAIEFKGTEVTVNLVKDRFEKFTLTKVFYPKKIKKIEKEYPFAMHYVLSTKMKNWKYEKEWRIICQLKENDDRILYYYPEKVKGFYVGHRLIDEDKSAYRTLLEICSIRFPNIPLFVVYPHPKELKLIFERVLN
jgi:hypothetical protein